MKKKIGILFFFILFVNPGLYLPVFAQNPSSQDICEKIQVDEDTDGNKVFTFQLQNVHLGSLLYRLGQESGRDIVISDILVDRLKNERISIICKSRPIEEILEILAGMAEVMVTNKDDKIFLYPLVQSKDWAEQAALDLKRFILRYHKDPRVPDTYFSLGILYSLQGRHDLALQEYENLVRNFPSYRGIPHALLGIGQSLIKLERYKDAEERLQQMINSFPKDPLSIESFYFLAKSLYYQNNPSYALKIYEYLENYFPTHPRYFEFRLAKGEMLFAQKQYKEAIFTFDNIIYSLKASPDTVMKAYLAKASCYYEQNEFESTLKEIVSLLQKSTKGPEAKEARRLAVKCYLKLDEPLKALIFIKSIIKDFPEEANNEEMFNLIGFQFQSMGLLEEALDYYKIGDSPGILFAKGMVYKTKKQWDKAIEAFMQVDGVLKEKAFLEIARCRFEACCYDECISEISHVLEKCQSQSILSDLFHLAGEAFTKLGQTEKALLAYQGKVEAFEKQENLK